MVCLQHECVAVSIAVIATAMFLFVSAPAGFAVLGAGILWMVVEKMMK